MQPSGDAGWQTTGDPGSQDAGQLGRLGSSRQHVRNWHNFCYAGQAPIKTAISVRSLFDRTGTPLLRRIFGSSAESSGRDYDFLRADAQS
jgi:hypothetical protein